VNQSPPAGAVVIAYGSPLRSDDGLGWRAAEGLTSSLRNSAIKIISRHQLAPELAEICSGAELVIFIDAASSGKPGKISCVPVSVNDVTSVSQAAAMACSHHLNPATLLSLSRTLYGRVPQAYVLSMAGERFELGEQLSAAVEAALPELISKARSLLEEHFHGMPGPMG
jgi:hydrogenase maturation protease